MMLILSPISRSLEFLLVNHISMCENFELKVFENINVYEKYLVTDQTIF